MSELADVHVGSIAVACALRFTREAHSGIFAEPRFPALARHAKPQPRLIGVFTAQELGLALGLDNVIHLAFLAGQGAGRWSVDVERLAGFAPLFPERWREEP